ncbi:vesicle transport protein SFT2C-like isoform X2 [Mercenaria mercenaria]|uniref:vesicle transport protein SFT2C-like isoform X2 n=1 Tax=Mercenaria mercenaria TaxID=6596 RepID=UPI00234EC2B9|nr:vesicle transport protein SFT2C-like isoform X2 [Mercenaria mercenaria]
MADISQSLKDYMSKSQSKEPLLGAENGSGSAFSFGKFNPFRKSESKVYDDSNEVANTWFSQAQKDPLCPGLTKKQRILGFVICLLMGTFCFSLACLYIPILILKARKFAMLYTVGSLFIIFSFSMLWGPMNHIKHLLAVERLPFTSVYFGTMFATIYFSIWVYHELYPWGTDWNEIFLKNILCSCIKNHTKHSASIAQSDSHVTFFIQGQLL